LSAAQPSGGLSAKAETQARSVDPVEGEIFRFATTSVVDEIEVNLTRTAYSELIYEYKDYCVGIVTADFQLLTQSVGSMPIFLGDLGPQVRDAVEVLGVGNLEEGDVFIHNWSGVNGQHLNHIACIAPVFDPENINAYEAGVKSVLFDGVLRANLTGYFYDYNNLQVSNFQQQTVVNENINARVFGLEGEFVLRPTDDLVFNSTVSYLNTEITDADFRSVNTLNPTAGNPNAIALKDLTNASVCVLEQDPAELAALGLTSLIGADLSTINPAFAAGNPLVASPFTACAALEDFIENSFNPAVGTSFEITPIGLEQSVDGNDLPSSPEFTVSAGAQYTFRLGNGLTITPRADAYYQTESFSTIFNEVQDELDSYVLANAQVTIAPENGNWYVRGFVQNLADKDVVLGLSTISGQTSGNFSQGFLNEPRRYGIAVGARF